MSKELTEAQRDKQRDIDLLRRRYTKDMRERLMAVDYRLASYFDDLTANVSVIFGDEQDRHNRWEVLCGCKFLRMFDTYAFNAKFVRFVILFREGQWERTGKTWRYISGGLKLPSTSGAKVYRWQPFQIFVLASVFGFMAWFNTHVEEGTKPELLSSERERDGMIWDFRRLIHEFIMYGPRKIDKTGLSAYIQVIFFLFGDFNSEIYSLAMTQEQSKILFDRSKFMLNQLSKDKDGNDRFRLTAKIVEWKARYQKDIRNSKIMPLTSGGKAPDGTNTELLDWDELGSSPYINGKSDMLAHINVCQSSMGQRRQPLTFGTTTAGTITSGPFIEKLDVLHRTLLLEHQYDDGTLEPTLSRDGTMCLLLEPDEWEREDEQYLLTSHALRRKINPMLGLVVQYDFYEREMDEARNEGGQKFAECISKLFNVYSSGRVTGWIKGDRIRLLQRPKRIEECRYDMGWRVFVGMDFSHGDDLFAMSFLAGRWGPGESMEGRLFADMRAWILEETLRTSPNRPLYEQWIAGGYLRVCPGEVFDSIYAINELVSIMYGGLDPQALPQNAEPVINFIRFGYDPAQNRNPINQLKAWLQTLFSQRGDLSTKDIAQLIERMVIAVSQTAFTMNPLIAHLEDLIKDKEVVLEFSDNPMWPWQFGNCAVEVTSTNLRRIIKGGPRPTHKIDNILALLDALACFDLNESNVS